MKFTFHVAVGLVLLNFFIVWWEFQNQGKGWRLYYALAVILLISTISLPIGLLLLIPITGYNLLMNTTRLLGRWQANEGNN
ncbi:MAG: hypothetical protein DDT41_01732 [candidate division WS2 bacterium]|nr:hypothetical protein [Candidatus Psychracetigena formicireducens]